MDWIKIAQLVVTVFVAGAAWWTLRQKIISDNRAEWWKRYTWVAENVTEDREQKIIHLKALKDSPLVTASEKNLIANLIVKQLDGYDRSQATNTIEGGQDNDKS